MFLLEPQSQADALFRTLARAEDLVSRLDFSEALAFGWASGQIVSAEGLMLHDADLDVHAPHQALAAVHGLVQARRKAAGGGLELFSPQGVAWLAGLRRRRPVAGAVTVPPTWGQDTGDGPDMVCRLSDHLDRLRAGDTASVGAVLLDGLGLLDRAGRDAPLLLQAAARLWRPER